jgi:ATP-dependent exoDNAse (exonuclease V) beta subunit
MRTIWLEASAGSGKTTFLIQKISLAKNIQPHEIMCLTFSKSAAQNMLEKSKNVFHQSEIHSLTLHALAYKLLKSKYQDKDISQTHFESEAVCKALQNKEFFELINWMINENEAILGNKENPIDNKEILEKSEYEPIFEPFIPLKNNDVLSKNEIAKIKDYLYTKDGSLRKKHKIPIKGDISELIEWAIHRINAHEKYHQFYAKFVRFNLQSAISSCESEIKDLRKVLYYDDLIYQAKKIIQNPNESQIFLQHFGSIKLLLIDEAQDISQSQWEMLFEIIQNWSTFEHELVVASDPKQLIYEFQGAKIETFYIYKEKICEISTNFEQKELNLTYRLPKKICDFVNIIGSKLNINFNNHICAREQEGRVQILTIKEIDDLMDTIKEKKDDLMIIFKQKSPRMEKLAKKMMQSGILIDSPFITQHPIIKDFQNLIKFIIFEDQVAQRCLFSVFNEDDFCWPEWRSNSEDMLFIKSLTCDNLEKLFFDWVENKKVRKFLKEKLQGSFDFLLDILFSYAIFYKNKAIEAIFDYLNYYKSNEHLFKGLPILNTIHSMKGREAEVVILCDCDFKSKFKNDTERLLYVGITRSKNELIIPIINENIEATWADLFGEFF